jgi:hypothetical protein
MTFTELLLAANILVTPGDAGLPELAPPPSKPTLPVCEPLKLDPPSAPLGTLLADVNEACGNDGCENDGCDETEAV